MQLISLHIISVTDFVDIWPKLSTSKIWIGKLFTWGPFRFPVWTSFWRSFWSLFRLLGQLKDSKMENDKRRCTKRTEFELKYKIENSWMYVTTTSSQAWRLSTSAAVMLVVIITVVAMVDEDGGGGSALMILMMGDEVQHFLYIQTPDRPPLRLLLVIIYIYIHN